MNIKLCNECKNFRCDPDDVCTGTDCCYSAKLHSIDFVYGGLLPYHKDCQSCRLSEKHCGFKAKWFEAKK